MEGALEALRRADTAVVLWLNGWVGHLPFLDALASLMVSDYFVPVLLSLVLLALWFTGRTPEEREHHQRTTILGLMALGFANLVVQLLNDAVFRPRPFAHHSIHLLFYMPTDSSFPSNPAAVGFAAATAVMFANRRLGVALYVLAAAFSLSRLYAGVCYPSDVIAGALIGTAMSYVARWVLHTIEPLPTMVLRAFRFFHMA